MCSVDEDCPFNEICFQATLYWKKLLGQNYSSCECDSWHGVSRDTEGNCVPLNNAGKVFLGIALTESVLNLIGVVWAVWLLWPRRGRKLSCTLSCFSCALSFLSHCCILCNRVITVVKVLTPEAFVGCCIHVFNEPRKYHVLRFPEMVSLFSGIAFAIASVLVLLYNVTKVHFTSSRMLRPEQNHRDLRKLKVLLSVVYLFCLATCGAVTAINTGFVGFVAIGFPLILLFPLLFCFVTIYWVDKGEATNGGYISDLKRQTRVLKINLTISSCVLLLGGLIYLLCNIERLGDWKGASPPNQLSLSMMGNNLFSISMVGYNYSVLWWFGHRYNDAPTTSHRNPSLQCCTFRRRRADANQKYKVCVAKTKRSAGLMSRNPSSALNGKPTQDHRIVALT